MFIETVYGIQATAISLNNRFTMLATEASHRAVRRRRNNFDGFLNQNINYNTEDLIELIARKLRQKARTRPIKQRLNMGTPLRRYGSENNLSLRRFSSSSNLSQRLGVRNRGAWSQSNNNLSRSMSFGNLSQGSWKARGLRRRGGRPPALRAQLSGGQLQVKRTLGRLGNGTQAQTQNVRRRMRGVGRGGTVKNQANKKTVPTKEELDAQLDQYMSSTKAALDQELDTYMKNVMDVE